MMTAVSEAMGCPDVRPPVDVSPHGDLHDLRPAIRIVEEAANVVFPGAAELDHAMGRLTLKIVTPEGKQTVAQWFGANQDDTDTAGVLVRSHLATFPNGFAHLVRKQTIHRVADDAARLLKILSPHTRAAMIQRWSMPGDRSLHVSADHCIVADIPDSGFRCLLIGKAVGESGLHLTQEEAVQLMHARPAGADDGRTVLDMLPALTTHHPQTTAHLLRALIDTNGRMPSTLNADALHALAISVFEALRHDGRRTVFCEAFARYFGEMEDYRRAADVRAEMAVHRKRDLPGDVYGISRFTNSGHDTAADVRRHAEICIANEHALAAHYYARCGELALAAKQHFKAAQRRAAAREPALAEHACTRGLTNLHQLAGVARYSEVAPVLREAFDAIAISSGRISATGTQCATAFAARGRDLSAAMTHYLTAERLPQIHEANLVEDADALAKVRDFHVSETWRYCTRARFDPDRADVPAAMRSAIASHLGKMNGMTALAGPDYTIEFGDIIGPNATLPFDGDPKVHWLLLETARGAKGQPVYQLVNTIRRREMLGKAHRHPMLGRALTSADFIGEVEALELLQLLQPGRRAR
ncbi:hypothetical protein [Pandoraea sp. ISTKB]|uniref:hypothetical protein n=1 Tax=Pandoraea sp. ISTKB TaxID=1586708 RepID=UPI001112ECC2|nr:hypothetical protein [Pandoraea sp. ISTKB]